MLRGLMLIGVVLAGPAAAQDCRIALTIGLDVSNSVDADEYALQTGGMAAALVAPEVQAAFFAAPDRFVALQVYEWSGRRRQQVQIDWIEIRRPEDLARAADALRAQPRSTDSYPTAIGRALEFGAAQLDRGPACAQSKIDIAGDGENNDAEEPETALGPARAAITVNALAIGERAEDLRVYYLENVARGPGAFVEVARDHADFERAMRRKLVRELTEAQVSGRPDPRARRWR